MSAALILFWAVWLFVTAEFLMVALALWLLAAIRLGDRGLR